MDEAARTEGGALALGAHSSVTIRARGLSNVQRAEAERCCALVGGTCLPTLACAVEVAPPLRVGSGRGQRLTPVKRPRLEFLLANEVRPESRVGQVRARLGPKVEGDRQIVHRAPLEPHEVVLQYRLARHAEAPPRQPVARLELRPGMHRQQALRGGLIGLEHHHSCVEQPVIHRARERAPRPPQAEGGGSVTRVAQPRAVRRGTDERILRHAVPEEVVKAAVEHDEVQVDVHDALKVRQPPEIEAHVGAMIAPRVPRVGVGAGQRIRRHELELQAAAKLWREHGLDALARDVVGVHHYHVAHDRVRRDGGQRGLHGALVVGRRANGHRPRVLVRVEALGRRGRCAEVRAEARGIRVHQRGTQHAQRVALPREGVPVMPVAHRAVREEQKPIVV
mmetsp:Transcript_7396/g.30035  ORF Transcript_7396/g.30035 Transcript_7396/m.30035 type:complete len:394 (-) Transcript_7396:568-1749(-)